MTIRDVWSTAFPIRPATDAIEALCTSWHMLANKSRKGFHPNMHEPRLTKALKSHVEHVTAPEQGLLGMWAAEAVYNEIDAETAELKEERRADIVYGWNDDCNRIELIFEFKKLSHLVQSQNDYLGTNGLGRFVDGIYARRQPIAAMVGILTRPKDMIIPRLRNAIAENSKILELRIKLRDDNVVLQSPSVISPTRADFDTEHERSFDLLAPDHDTIRIAHIFLAFCYTR